MLGRRMRRRGLLRAAATTAFVAGTATAVSGGVRSWQAANGQQADEAEAYEEQQQQERMAVAAQQAAPAQQVAAAVPTVPDLVAQIQQLAALHGQGILSDSEFVAAKAKLLP